MGRGWGRSESKNLGGGKKSREKSREMREYEEGPWGKVRGKS